MKELTLVLDDDSLYSAIEAEAISTGCAVQDVIVQALREWRTDAELDVEERDEVEKARREWEEQGGMEAQAFFDSLREEEPDHDL